MYIAVSLYRNMRHTNIVSESFLSFTSCESFQISHIWAKSINIWLRYDPPQRAVAESAPTRRNTPWSTGPSSFCDCPQVCVEVWKQEVIFCFESYFRQILMDFASIWIILKAKSCWADISEYETNTNMKKYEYETNMVYPTMPKTQIRWKLCFLYNLVFPFTFFFRKITSFVVLFHLTASLYQPTASLWIWASRWCMPKG